jgi:hypothetical protein
MKLKHFFIGLLLVFLPLKILSQVDSTSFYNFKLKADKVQIWERRDNKPDRTKTRRIVDSYFFFTENGIYGADSFGMMIYEFTSPLEFYENYPITKYFIKATDVDQRKNCDIAVYYYHEQDKYKMFVKYKVNQYIFNCVSVK